MPMLVQEGYPIRPVLPPGIIERGMSALVSRQQHLRCGADEHLHYVVIRRTGEPAGVVHGGPSHIVANAGGHAGLVEKKADDVGETPPARRVEDALPEAIARLHEVTQREQ